MLSVEQNAQKARKPNTEDTPADNHPTSKLSQEQEVQEKKAQTNTKLDLLNEAIQKIRNENSL